MFKMVPVGEVIREYRRGAPVATILEKYGLNKARFYKLLHEHGVPLRRAHRKEEILELVKRGLSDAEVASRLGVSKAYVAMVRLKHGIYRRGPRMPYQAWLAKYYSRVVEVLERESFITNRVLRRMVPNRYRLDILALLSADGYKTCRIKFGVGTLFQRQIQGLMVIYKPGAERCVAEYLAQFYVPDEFNGRLARRVRFALENYGADRRLVDELVEVLRQRYGTGKSSTLVRRVYH